MRVMMALTTSLTRVTGWYSVLCILMVPDSILEKSSMSLIMVRSVCPEDLIWLIYSLAAGGSGSRIAISDMPIIAFIGVRISWLILARKSDFDCVACSSSIFDCRILKRLYPMRDITLDSVYKNSAASLICVFDIIGTRRRAARYLSGAMLSSCEYRAACFSSGSDVRICPPTKQPMIFSLIVIGAAKSIMPVWQR